LGVTSGGRYCIQVHVTKDRGSGDCWNLGRPKGRTIICRNRFRRCDLRRTQKRRLVLTGTHRCTRSRKPHDGTRWSPRPCARERRASGIIGGLKHASEKTKKKPCWGVHSNRTSRRKPTAGVEEKRCWAVHPTRTMHYRVFGCQRNGRVPGAACPPLETAQWQTSCHWHPFHCPYSHQ
jgi:hypothetical protein